MKKLYALLLVVVMLAASLVACNDNNTNSEPTDQSKGNESTASVGEASEAVSEPENTGGSPKKNGIQPLHGLPRTTRKIPLPTFVTMKSGAKRISAIL